MSPQYIPEREEELCTSESVVYTCFIIERKFDTFEIPTRLQNSFYFEITNLSEWYSNSEQKRDYTYEANVIYRIRSSKNSHLVQLRIQLRMPCVNSLPRTELALILQTIFVDCWRGNVSINRQFLLQTLITSLQNELIVFSRKISVESYSQKFDGSRSMISSQLLYRTF